MSEEKMPNFPMSTITYTVDQVEAIKRSLEANAGHERISKTYACVEHLWPDDTDTMMLIHLIEDVSTGRDMFPGRNRLDIVKPR